MKILFYSDIPRLFRSTLLGYLYEISQVFPVILLSEKLDPALEEVIGNKRLFPKLEKIIQVRQYDGKKTNPIDLIAKHKCFSKLAEDLISKYKPDVIFATGANIFESYLRRFAKKTKAVTVSGTGPFFIVRPEGIKTFRELLAANNKLSFPLPKAFRVFLSRLRQYSAHVFYYYISPLLAGQKPFFNQPSVILWDVENVRGADYYFVFSKLDYDIITRKNKALSEKLFILSHPLLGKGKEIFEEIKRSDGLKKKKGEKIAIVMWPEIQIGFKRKDFSLILKEDVQKEREEVVDLISGILKGWRIFIKPHPMVNNNPGQLTEITKSLKALSDKIEIIDPAEPAERYVKTSDVILGLAPASASLYNAFLLAPGKPILSVDLNAEFLGDAYKNFAGIEYIDSREKLGHVVELIAKDSYNKKIGSQLKSEGFSSIIEAFRSVLKIN